ncbi:MAG TPA: sulfatase-like hydrolase/transferase [Polyangiales bacterium]|nr:sulfatase-like hydrolase/transferase [Polyangiales bacterium]
MVRTTWAALLGCALGAVAGVLSGLGDFGAHWLWLDTWPDRAVLLLRVIGLQAPLGAALGLVIGAMLGASEGAIERLAQRARNPAARGDALHALRLSVLLAPALFWIGGLLFSGGTMSRVAGREWLAPLAGAGLVLGVFGAGWLAHALARRCRAPAQAARLALLAAVLGFSCGKLNQWVLPKLYDYLHGALVAASFLCFLGGAFVLVAGTARPRLRRTLELAGLPVLLACGWLFSATIGQLDGNQNVRVALMHPNAPASRALMQALAPVLLEPAQRAAIARAKLEARRARGRRTTRGGEPTGPVLDDAHVLLITIDALRPDHLGAYGYARPTSPALDRLAASSVLFERAYAQAPHSSYSLCSLMTSEYLHETLALGSPAPVPTLASTFAAAGYHTAGFYSAGIFHTEAERLQQYEREALGFALHDQVTYTAEALTDRVLQEVDRTAQRGEPNTLLWAHYFDVHEPYRSTHFGTSDLDRYDSEILHVDREVDRLVREVRARLERPVIVVISADHGEEFHEHGGVYHGSSLYDEQVRVPLIVNVPGVAARRVSTPVESVDIAPTVLGLAGLPVPGSMRGDDLRDLLSSGTDELGPVFSAVIHKKMVVRWPHKLVADLRFGLFELYDLERDPGERNNLSDRDPALLASLRGEIYAWLDALAPQADEQNDPAQVALDWGRLRDRRAVDPLARLVADASGREAQRIEAAKLLGILADERATAALVQAMNAARPPRVAAEAAIALGRMFDERARDALRRLVSAEDPDIRARAAVSLGRLRDPLAVPALSEALWIAQSDYEREEAVRWLGRIRDPRALAPLIQLLSQQRLRYLVVVALGMLDDERAYEPLADVLTWDEHANVRDGAVRGLSLLGDPRAIDAIAALAVRDPTIKQAAESLVRLNAIKLGKIGGVDGVHSELDANDFGNCHEGPVLHDWDFEHRTHCSTRKDSVTLALRAPTAVSAAASGNVLVLTLRRSDAAAAVEVQVQVGATALPAIRVDDSWHEYRWSLPEGSIPHDHVPVRLSSLVPGARFALDHALLLPVPSQLLAQFPQ